MGGGGGQVCESVGKADLLSDHFDSKRSRKAVDLPQLRTKLETIKQSNFHFKQKKKKQP